MSIVLENLVKRFGAQTVVDRVSLEIREGELLVLLGPSGSGKSTILRMIAGLVPVDDGRVLLDGADVTDLSPQERAVGFVFQSYALFPHMTVAENVEFGLAVRKVPRAERVARRDELLALVGLAGFGGRSVRRLSGGQQQRVAVARALAFQPSVLLLDEPFGALDVQIRGALRTALREIQRRLGVTTILVTHDQQEAFELADRIGVVDQGRLLEVGEPEALYRNPTNEFVAGFLGDANLFGVRPEDDGIPFGPLRLPLAAEASRNGGPGRWAVLLRPEDVAVAPGGGRPEGEALGAGRIEEIVALGSRRRATLRLEPIAGAWALGGKYGGSGVEILADLPPRGPGEAPLEPGAEVEVGLRRWHALARHALRVLVVADGSPAFPAALASAGGLVRAMGGRLTVLCVAPDASAGQRRMAAVQEALSAGYPGAAIEARIGALAREVLREARGRRHDLVVLPGWSAASDVGGAGAAAGLEIARRATTPVLVARGDGAAPRRILLCTAAGEAGKADVVLGGRIARATGAEATLFHVEPASGTPEGPEWVRRHLADGAETLRAQGARARARTGRGDVVEAIAAESADGDYDVVVVGSHQAGTRGPGRQRDVASELIARLDRSVLVVHSAWDG